MMALHRCISIHDKTPDGHKKKSQFGDLLHLCLRLRWGKACGNLYSGRGMIARVLSITVAMAMGWQPNLVDDDPRDISEALCQ